jgi:uncharacterized protein YndB with AHSA1/START domain
MTPAESPDSIALQIVIQASADRIFAAIANPLERVKWWGVAGQFQATSMESDLRPGGAWLMRGIGNGGQPFKIQGEYRIVQPPDVLEFTWQPDWEEPSTVVRFELREQNGATTVRLTHSGFQSPASRERYQGWPWLLSLLQTFVNNHPSGSSS